jgi:uncharacterized protein (TIGR00730 family)
MNETTPVVAVFGASSSSPGDGHYEAGVTCGRLLAEAGFTVATGGYAGLMEAVSEGAASAGGHVIGVTVPPVFPDRHGANPHVIEERRARTLTERIHELIAVSDASIALHGSIGTATELLVAWNLAYVARFAGLQPRPVVAVGARWRGLVATLTMTLETDVDLVTCVDDVADAVATVVRRLTPP